MKLTGYDEVFFHIIYHFLYYSVFVAGTSAVYIWE